MEDEKIKFSLLHYGVLVKYWGERDESLGCHIP